MIMIFEHNSEKLIAHYLKRGYPEKGLRKHYKKARGFTQDDLLDVKVKTPVKTPVMVTNFNPMNPNIKGIRHRNWNIISNSPDCSQIFTEKPLIGIRRLPNVREYLTKATIQYPPVTQDIKKTHTPVCTRLGRCKYCPLIKKVDPVICNFTKKSFHTIDLPKHVTCELSNIIYRFLALNATSTMSGRHVEHLE